jgi:HK97 family phage portal protein
MKFLDFLAAPASALFGESRNGYGSPENPSVPLSGAAFDGLMEPPAHSGVKVSQKTALRYAPLWRGVALIASSVAKLPLYVYQATDDDTRERYKKHAAYRLLRRKPNTEMHAFTFKQTLQAHALTRGNGYAWINRDTRDGRPLEVIPLNPDTTYPVRENGRLWYVTPVGNEMRKIEPSDVLHIKGWGFDGLVGYDVIAHARNSLGLGMAAEEYGSRFFSNNARPSVVIEHPKTLTREALIRLRDSWASMHAGLSNSHRAAVLEEGAKLNPFSINANDAQLIETRMHEVRSVANWLGCPPHKLGDNSRTAYASLEQENQAFLDDCLDPWLCAWEHECDDKLLTEEEKEGETAFTEFNRNVLVRADMGQRYSAYTTALGGRPFATQNEIRRKENMPPIEGGDVVLEPLNMAKPGGPVNEKPNPPPPPKEEPKEAKSDEALRMRVLTGTLERMVRRLSVHARKAAKEPRTFLAAIDTIEAENRATVLDALDAAARLAAPRDSSPKELTDMLFAEFRRELLETSERHNAATLATGIDANMTAAETFWPAKLADQLTKGI